MTHTAAAAKSLRQNEKRRLLNKARVSELRTLRKKLLRSIHDGKQDEAQTLFVRLTKRMDQAAARGVLHKNTANRSKSRLAKHLGTMKAA